MIIKIHDENNQNNKQNRQFHLNFNIFIQNFDNISVTVIKPTTFNFSLTIQTR